MKEEEYPEDINCPFLREVYDKWMVECAFVKNRQARRKGFWSWYNTVYSDSEYSSEDECPGAPKKARMGGPSA